MKKLLSLLLAVALVITAFSSGNNVYANERPIDGVENDNFGWTEDETQDMFTNANSMFALKSFDWVLKGQGTYYSSKNTLYLKSYMLQNLNDTELCKAIGQYHLTQDDAISAEGYVRAYFTNIFGVTDSASDSYRCWGIGYSVAETPTAAGGNGWSGTARTNIGDNYTSQ